MPSLNAAASMKAAPLRGPPLDGGRCDLGSKPRVSWYGLLVRALISSLGLVLEVANHDVVMVFPRVPIGAAKAEGPRNQLWNIKCKNTCEVPNCNVYDHTKPRMP